MKVLKCKSFTLQEALCKFVNEHKVKVQQIVSNNSTLSSYVLFYWEKK
jgi:hypothetical protein